MRRYVGLEGQELCMWRYSKLRSLRWGRDEVLTTLVTVFGLLRRHSVGVRHEMRMAQMSHVSLGKGF